MQAKYIGGKNAMKRDNYHLYIVTWFLCFAFGGLLPLPTDRRPPPRFPLRSHFAHFPLHQRCHVYICALLAAFDLSRT